MVTPENTMLDEIHKDIEQIKRQLSVLSAILVDRMSKEDIADYEKAMQEYKRGATVKLSDLNL
ncbi:MAG: hypothetical protein AABW86_05245 [Candidatus Micrarchaeota archaeon]